MIAMAASQILRAYHISQRMQYLFEIYNFQSSPPLIFQDSLTPIPDHPFCAMGVLTAQAKWGSKKSVAFVIEDNYLLTCASNCYQHGHGEYSDITFTINSHRKAGYDTHKVSKVLIPQQYKTLPKDKRNQYNYAVLYIDGQPNMSDRYGSIGIQFQAAPKIPITYLECSESDNRLLFVGEHAFAQNLPMVLSGTPLLIQDYNGRKTAVGLIFSENKRSKSSFVQFSPQNKRQLQTQQRLKVQNGIFDISYSNPKQFTMRFLKNQQEKPIQSVNLINCNLDEWRCFSICQLIPFSAVSQINLSNNQLGNNLKFLTLDKFRCLKQLFLQQISIGPSGCKMLVATPLQNLRFLSLSQNRIGNQGCKHMTKANWPKLYNLQLYCDFDNEGVSILLEKEWKNLSNLKIGQNKIDNDVSDILLAATLSLIEFISLDKSEINQLGLLFLNSPSWKRLIRLSLNQCMIGSRGCKMIKQSDLALVLLSLADCHISSAGVKWLCKANLKRMNTLVLNNNSITNDGCFTLSRAKMIRLQQINLLENAIRLSGIKRLKQAEWTIQIKTDFISQLYDHLQEILE